MIYCPKFVYIDEENEQQILILNEPQRPWSRKARDIGGWGRTSSGFAESYVIREDYLLVLNLRIRETEEQNFEAFLRWARRNAGSTFDFYFDRNDTAGLKKVCDLDSPQVGEDITFNQTEFPFIKEISMTIRSANGSAFARNYYSDL